MPVTHRESNTRLYNIWVNMKARCYRPTGRGYKDYGGRGIIMCDEWKNSYEAFRDWSKNNGYRDDLSIDRIDNDGNYEPNNCRWVDIYIQANNKRDNRFVTVDGETKTISQWSRIVGINKKTIQQRLDRGMSDEDAIKTPIYDSKMINIGKKYNHLTVLKYIETKNHNNYFLCKCDCGKEEIYKGNSVFTGHRKSCGCSNGTHRMTGTKLHKIWLSARHNRGLCKIWDDDFTEFYKWSTQNGYKDGLILGRIDKNKPCSPDNCEWLTRKQMQNKMTNCNFYECNGERHTLSEWEEITGNSYGAMKERIKKGWDIESALFAPKGYKYTENGKYETTHDR